MSSGSFPPFPDSPRPSQPPLDPRVWESATYLRPRPQPKERVWLHVLLFVLTVISATWAVSAAYAACLLLILTCHEFGHYFAARYHRVKASLPYFLPSPFIFGTFGAVIRMSPYIPNRRALFDIAAAGPIAGLVVALPISLIGMLMSDYQPVSALAGNYITLGDPLFFTAMQWLLLPATPEGHDLLLHDVAFAGWVGMFVTALNLLPIGQLDGGHITYSVFGQKSRYVAMAAFGALALATFVSGYGYLVFLALLWYMGVSHPPTLDDRDELGATRRNLAIMLLVVFILCFTPAPLRMPGQ